MTMVLTVNVKLVWRCYNPTFMPKMSISYTYQTLVPVVIKVTENEGECNENVGKKKKKGPRQAHF